MNILICIGDVMGLFNIWVTHSCNLNCSYCYESGIREDLSFDQKLFDDLIFFIVETSKNWEEVMINFHGGEPLMNFEFIKRVVCKLEDINLNCFYSLTTNGILLNDTIINFLIKYDVSLSVSIDGDRISNDISRRDWKGKSVYDIVVKKISLCLEKGIEPRIRMTVVPENVQYLSQGVKSLWEMGCKTLVAAPDLFNPKWSVENIAILKRELKKIRSLEDNGQKTFDFFDHDPHRKKGRCCGGVYEYSISTTGDLYPCTFVYGKKEYCIGNIKTGIDDKKIKNLRAVYSEDNYNCINCKDKEYCIANRCKYINMAVCNDYLEAPKLVCQLVNLLKSVKK